MHKSRKHDIFLNMIWFPLYTQNSVLLKKISELKDIEIRKLIDWFKIRRVNHRSMEKFTLNHQMKGIFFNKLIGKLDSYLKEIYAKSI